MRKPDDTATEIRDANLVSFASANTRHRMSPGAMVHLRRGALL